MDIQILRKTYLDDRIGLFDGSTLDATAHMLFVLPDSDRLMQVAARFVAEKLDACRADIGFGNSRAPLYRSSIEFLSSASAPPSMTVVDLPNQDKIVQKVWTSSHPVAFSGCYTRPDFESLREGMIVTRTQSLIARRLDVENRSFGLICVDQTTHSREWDSRAIEFLDTFCSHVLSPLLDISARLNGNIRPSPAELDAIRLASLGLSYKQIAKHLNKSIRTVEHQLRNARRKMGASNQADLIRKCQAWI